MSFAGKYLHFIFPSIFPPWDSLALQAINTLSKQEIFPAKALKPLIRSFLKATTELSKSPVYS
jgi:hypothetical protein